MDRVPFEDLETYALIIERENRLLRTIMKRGVIVSGVVACVSIVVYLLHPPR